ncbi:MAG TPA: hypothetical protein VKF41_04930 [Bryobacteraceae bacterium]|nr:hypothetical protein [Bryobacteraceae bacterium]
MATWNARYKAGEYTEVWAEMQALGAGIRKPARRKAADAVVRETMKRARGNVERLLAELPGLGYRFQGVPEPAEPDYPLELRIEHALEYVANRGGKQHKANPWSHPALAWVEEEEIEVPARFRRGNLGRSTHRPPDARMSGALDEIERQTGSPLPLAVRAWFETVGAVNLAGTHPMLNPDGAVDTLRVTPEGIDRAVADGAGAGFVSVIRHAFAWGGFPGWSGRAYAPERELAWLRSKLLPL